MKKKSKLSTEVVKRNALTGGTEAPKKRFGKKEKKKYAIIIILIITIICGIKYGINRYELKKEAKEREERLGPVTEIEGETPDVNDKGEIIEEKDEIKIYSINIGNGYSTLVKCNDTDVLIDGGGDVKDFVSKHISGPLEYVVVTNSYDENIKGLPELYKSVDVEKTIVANVSKEPSKAFKELEKISGGFAKNIEQRIKLTDKASVILGTGVENPTSMEDKTSIVSVTDGESNVVITGKSSESNLKQFLATDTEVSYIITDGKPQRISKPMLSSIQPSGIIITSKNPKNGGTLDKNFLSTLDENQIYVYTTYTNGSITLNNKDGNWGFEKELKNANNRN